MSGKISDLSPMPEDELYQKSLQLWKNIMAMSFAIPNTTRDMAISLLGDRATALYGEDNWTVEQDGDYWTARPIKND